MKQDEFGLFNYADEPSRFSRQTNFFGQGGSGKAGSPGRTEKKAAKPEPKVYSVTQLTRMVKLVLSEGLPGKIVLAGEISNYKRHSSGHIYLTIKDENAQIAAVMWKNGAGKLKFQPADGMAVVATGRVDVYEPQGKYQFYIEKLEPAGAGALDLAFRQLAEKLREEGLFEAEHKKELPRYPATIGIVTSGTGAAIEDISKTLKKRFPSVRKLLYPVRVQGEGAAEEIAGAIRDLNRRREQLGGIDVLIVGRGGGSLEDLWAFNEEIVARAIFASQIPIISAVGHEIDVTIADMVADERAATPTAAAERAVPERNEILQSLRQTQQLLYAGVRHSLEGAKSDWENLAERSMFVRPLDLLRVPRQLLDERSATLGRCFSELVHQTARRLEGYTRILRGIEPHQVLAKGQKQLTELGNGLRMAWRDYGQRRKEGLTLMHSRLQAGRPQNRIELQGSTLKNLAGRMAAARGQFVRRQQERLAGLNARLGNLDPRAVLRRGYSITRLKSNRQILNDKSKIKVGELLLTELAQETQIESEVTALSEKQKRPPADQGAIDAKSEIRNM